MSKPYFLCGIEVTDEIKARRFFKHWRWLLKKIEKRGKAPTGKLRQYYCFEELLLNCEYNTKTHSVVDLSFATRKDNLVDLNDIGVFLKTQANHLRVTAKSREGLPLWVTERAEYRTPYEWKVTVWDRNCAVIKRGLEDDPLSAHFAAMKERKASLLHLEAITKYPHNVIVLIRCLERLDEAVTNGIEFSYYH